MHSFIQFFGCCCLTVNATWGLQDSMLMSVALGSFHLGLGMICLLGNAAKSAHPSFNLLENAVFTRSNMSLASSESPWNASGALPARHTLMQFNVASG